MGYGVTQCQSEFSLRRENFEKALAAIQELHGEETCGDNFSCVSSDFYKIDDLLSMLSEWNWYAETSSRCHICGLSFEGESLGDEDILFSAIAPFVEPDSYIEMFGEDGVRWRWVFDGNTCVRKTAKLVWE